MTIPAGNFLAFDSGNPAAIPPGSLCFGYIDGSTRWPADDLDRAALTITVFDSLTGDINDCENGNPTTPAKFCVWAKGRLLLGDFAPRIYGTAGYTAPHRRLADQMHIPYRWWQADWTGRPHIPAGADACQFASPSVPALTEHGDFDLSEVTPYFLREGISNMTNLNAPIVGGDFCAGGGYWMVGADGGVFAFGGAPELGTLVGKKLARPIVGIKGTRTGLGYMLWGADGGAYAFGDAQYAGSIPGDNIGPAPA